MQNLALVDVLVKLHDALKRNDLAEAAAIIEALRAPDQADIFSELEDAEQATLLPKLHPSQSADILEELDELEAAEVVADLPTDTVIRIVDEMEADEAADLLGDIHPKQAEAVLAGLEDPDEVRPLLMHPDDSAGGLMTSEFLALRPGMTATEAIEAIRAWQPDVETVYYLFVVDSLKRLCGIVNLRQLIIAEPNALISDIMDREVISVPVGTDQEECARLITRYDLLALPVLDDQGMLLGVITVDDVIDVIEDEATEDIQRLGGAEPLDRSYLDASVLTVVRKRIGWLLLLFVTGSLTGTVMRYFESELQSVVALAFFIPLLIGTGGNAGSQTTSTIIRALAVGDIDLGDAMSALWHELQAGLLLGFVMAVVAYLRAITWGSGQPLALAVSSAIFLIVIWANGMGSILPLLAARLRLDPTVVSGPLMSTLVDTTGLLIYFTIATVVLSL